MEILPSFQRSILTKIKDMNGEEIKGTFYEQEMQKSTQETFRIKKVVKTKGDKLLGPSGRSQTTLALGSLRNGKPYGLCIQNHGPLPVLL
jgi:hypothetical protein